MYLSALELQGFKSFPTRQYIEFHPGYTCIVGPNGCGKSNVTDAVRWVLGEQSPKSMRGDKMQDVIFNGTDQRNSMSFAEVSMYINNEDGYLNLPQDEIVITRRYYRSGESEYSLNRQTCRLKDITELFADTGLGKGGYSLIEQGRVDEILSERTDDRRKVFDEAAGIVKYKMRKKESERKLSRTEEDLLRISDLSHEIEKNLKPLAKQAKEAEAYKEIAAEVRNLDIFLSTHKLSEAENKVQNSLAEYQSLESELEELAKNLEELNQERNSIFTSRKANQEKADNLQDKYNQLTRELAYLAEQDALAADAQKRDSQRLLNIDPELQQLSLQSSGLEDKIQRRISRKDELGQRKVEQEKILADLQNSAHELEEALSERDQAEAIRKKNILLLREELFQKRSAKISRESEIKARADERSEDSANYKDLAKKISYEKSQLEELEAELKTAQETLKKSSDHVGDLKNKLSQQKEAAKDNSQNLAEALREYKQEEFSLSTLERLEENREGYHYAVQNLARKISSDENFAQGFIGTVAELIHLDEKYELATEMSLGGTLHNVVCETREDAKRFIAWLKAERAGRETFLPLDNLESRSLSPSESQSFKYVHGYLGTLADHMQVDEDLNILKDYLGGRILLAEDIDSALELSEASGKRLKIATLGGEIIHPGGSLSGGANKKGSSGLLSRSREIAEAQLNLERLDKKINKLEEERKTLEEDSQTLIAELKQAEELERENLSQAQNLRTDYSVKEELLKAQNNALAELSNKINAKEEKQKDSQAQIELLAQEIDKLREQISQLENSEQIPAEQNLADQEKLDRLREDITDVKVSLASLNEAIKGIEEMSEQLESEQAQRSENISRLEAEKLSLKENIAQSKANILKFAEEKISKEKELNSISAEQDQLKLDNAALSEVESINFKKHESTNASFASLQSKRERSKAENERLEEKLLSEKNRIWEEYRLSFNQAKDLAASLELSEADPKRLKILKEKLRSMPAVNHAAPEQYKEMRERYELITEQKSDILSSKAQLLSVIRELEEAMRKQFADEFEAINQEFQTCFRELFSGGSAEISLGEGDVLDCDIEIKAQPPGKRLQNLSLLSGGERALTAIALVFAIFRQKPAPFCFLDEVDSALDEANILRFADFIRSYTDNTQFVIVTHRKGTMEAADQLYGVTMKERGVSTILSLALSEGEQYVRV